MNEASIFLQLVLKGYSSKAARAIARGILAQVKHDPDEGFAYDLPWYLSDEPDIPHINSRYERGVGTYKSFLDENRVD